jgi:protein-L-isoaspartate O-methyltransferase
MTLGPAYFDAMYAGSRDPWLYRSRWYEQRKRAIVMASLPLPRYARAFEPGASIGELSAALATRCETLLAYEPQRRAAALARARLCAFNHVRVEERSIPSHWPDGRFDLIVISEVAYYLNAAELATTVALCAKSLRDAGTLLLCHWRPAVDRHISDADQIHARFSRDVGLVRTVQHVERDFLLDVYDADPRSVGQREGLS